jgi:UDP-glucose 4-epimerase
MSRYLVTGGAGFIGSHLVDALVAQGDQVRVLDDLSTWLRGNLPAAAELVVGSVTDPAAVRAALAGVDGCFHLAAVASVEKGVNDWVGTHGVNLGGAVVVFDSVRRMATRVPVVYASSAAVYGDVATVPITERCRIAPLSAYGADKAGCEMHARVASRAFGIPAAGLRFFNVYGPRQDPRSPYSGVISIFCQRILAGLPVVIHGDGSQTRDFIYVADVVAALLAAMALRPVDAPVFNVCTGVPTSVRALALLIGELAGRAPDIREGPSRAGDIRESVGKAEGVLQLPPRTALRDGLGQVLLWLNEAQG